MRHLILAAALLTAALTGTAAAQGMAPNGVVFGQNWNMPQDFSTQTRMQAAQGSGSAADRAARAARQSQFNRNFPGTPIRRTSARG